VCGIAGLFGVSGAIAPEVARAGDAMTDAIAHRGPDGRGVRADARAVLGHRRLSIIDVSLGAQPMSTADGRLHIVFNGEVYNHRQLREGLEARGHVFRTHSDTEVILVAYREYGAACVPMLEGMFAFAIYDEPAGMLFAARDRLGKKPFYYAVLGGVLHFASEIKAIAASPLWDGTIDGEALESYLSLGYVVAPRTMYRRVRMLAPAHTLEVRNGAIREREYWDVTDFDSDRRSESAIDEDLSDLLRARVRERLESEVPLGAFLSGGIDSGLVVSYMAELTTSPVETTAVGFGDARHNELDAAGQTAAHCGTHHHAEVAEPRLDEVLEPIVAAFDQPFADSSAIPTYYVSAMARRHVTVALSGDGGDEVFGGYDFRYVPHAVEDRIRRGAFGGAARLAARAARGLWPRSPRLPRPLRLGTILDNLSVDAATAYYYDLCFLKPARTRALLGRPSPAPDRESELYESVTAPYRRCPSTSALQRAQYADLKVYLPNDPLVKVDRMSMQHGLEVRCPLLDRRVVEFGFRIPTERKMPRLRAKHLLKQLAARRLPPQLLTLPKHGFTAPVGAWLTGPYAAAFRADVLGADSYVGGVIDRALVARAFDEHAAGRADHAYLLWAAWVLERWGRAQRASGPAASGSRTH
jgi:asparagine synthase (glutamine-hydrolysing)